jgi:hypothetical protein
MQRQLALDTLRIDPASITCHDALQQPVDSVGFFLRVALVARVLDRQVAPTRAPQRTLRDDHLSLESLARMRATRVEEFGREPAWAARRERAPRSEPWLCAFGFCCARCGNDSRTRTGFQARRKSFSIACSPPTSRRCGCVGISALWNVRPGRFVSSRSTAPPTSRSGRRLRIG